MRAIISVHLDSRALEEEKCCDAIAGRQSKAHDLRHSNTTVSFTHSLTHSLTQSSPTHSLTHSLNQSITPAHALSFFFLFLSHSLSLSLHTHTHTRNHSIAVIHSCSKQVAFTQPTKFGWKLIRSYIDTETVLIFED